MTSPYRGTRRWLASSLALAGVSSGASLISVRVLDEHGTPARADDVVAPFSGRGPTADGVGRPDLVAPDGYSFDGYSFDGSSFDGYSFD